MPLPCGRQNGRISRFIIHSERRDAVRHNAGMAGLHGLAQDSRAPTHSRLNEPRLPQTRMAAPIVLPRG